MRAVRRAFSSPRPLLPRVSASINQRTHISSVASTSARPPLQEKARGRADNSSLAVESGLNPKLVDPHLFAPRSPNTAPSNHTPNRDSLQDGKQIIYSILDIYSYSFGLVILTPLHQYQKLIDSGVLQGDDHQTRIIQKLQDLHDQLVTYEPPQIPEASNSNSLVWRFSFSRKVN